MKFGSLSSVSVSKGGHVVRLFVFCLCASKEGHRASRAKRGERGARICCSALCLLSQCLGSSLASLRSARSVPGHVVHPFVFCDCASACAIGNFLNYSRKYHEAKAYFEISFRVAFKARFKLLLSLL